MREYFGDRSVLYLDCDDGGGGYTTVFVKIHRTVNLERMNFTLHTLYLDKTDF